MDDNRFGNCFFKKHLVSSSQLSYSCYPLEGVFLLFGLSTQKDKTLLLLLNSYRLV